MSLVAKIDAVMRAASKPLSARHVHAMMPTGTNLDTVGTLLSQRRRAGLLRTVTVDGVVCYEVNTELEDEPLERGRPGRKPRMQDAIDGPSMRAPASPVLVEFVRAGEIIASESLDTLIANRGPRHLIDMIGDAARDLSEARYQLTLTVQVPDAASEACE
ncbi:hypothetical protein [Dyella japonica]|uniref:Uncharacterized protein n=1 Tax=Dyella japonica DSM 16301 TaxID=1440762 RepID=A0A0G9HCL9_9GAMM|nr:hypothetical protein [Dyella japonica]KLD65452.1 hypothetical protein Y882_02740 [Dyella japonica DSM 16301]